MSYALLRAFHAVAEEGGFTRAAQALHVTQPTLSGQVKALEEAYGVMLFERRGRSVEVTDLGRELLGITRRMFGLEEEARQLLAAARGLTRGTLRVAADAPSHIALLARFNRRYPGIALSFSLGNSEQVLHAILERRADVAVLPDAAEDERLACLPYRQERLVAFVGDRHPWAGGMSVRLAELAGERLIQREPGSRTRALVEAALAEHGVQPREVLEIGSREAVREAVASGLGVSVVFESELGRDDRLRRLVFDDVRLLSTEYVVCLAGRRELPVVAAFFDIVGDGAGA